MNDQIVNQNNSLSLQVLHKKSTSKSFTWLHVEKQKDSFALASSTDYPDRFTILWERIRDKSEGNGAVKHEKCLVVEVLHVGDIIELFEYRSFFWKRPDLLYLTADANVKLKSVWRETGKDPFKPIPPPPKDTMKEASLSRNIESEYCKYWIYSQQCPFANQDTHCPRLHPIGSELRKIRDEWVAAKKLYRKSMTSSDDPHKDSKTSKASKAKVFADFLEETFHLSSDSFLLDVAAGRGTISIELFLRHRIKSILVDPRDDCCRGLKYQEKQLKSINVHDRGYSHLKAWFDSEFVKNNPYLLQKTTLLIGMHPDQATESIIDAALLLNKPFAIVPCCVFSGENTHRTMNGKPVILYEEFIEYLMKKDLRIEKTYLPFEGKNICLYMR